MENKQLIFLISISFILFFLGCYFAFQPTEVDFKVLPAPHEDNSFNDLI